MRTMLAIGLAVAAAASTFALNVPTAEAADAVETYQNLDTGLCLEDEGDFAWSSRCAGLAIQKWRVHHWADGTVRFQSVGRGACLADISSKVETRRCDSSTQQSWFVKHYSDGSVRFQNQATRMCIADSRVTGVRRETCTDSVGVRFK